MMLKTIYQSTIRFFLLTGMVILLIFSSFTAASAAPTEKTEPNAESGSTGWIEISAAVPADFTTPLVVSLVNTKTEEEFDFQVLFQNAYTSMEELPVGTYTFNYGFVEGGDFRYKVVPVEQEYIVAFNEVAASVKLDVIFNDEYAEDGEPATEEPLQNNVEETPEEPVEDPISDSDTPAAEQEREETTAMKILRRVGIALTGAAIFTGIVYGAVYYIRKNSDD